MLLDAWEGRRRSLAKAISWRLAGSIDTLMLSYLVTRRLVLATTIAGAETITKIALYYAHERAWTIIPWGKRSRGHRMRLRLWGRVAKATTLPAALVAFLLALHPARIAAIGCFVFCLIIVMTPTQFHLRRSGISESATAAGKDEIRPVAADLRDRATIPSAVLDTEPHPGRASEPAEPAQAADADLQTTKQPAVEIPRRGLIEHDRAKEVQQKLIQLGYLSVSATGMWGPLSRKALKAFKSDHDLPPDESWDEATERRLFSGSLENTEPFVGIWGVDASACSPRLNRNGFLPAVINSGGAWAGETFCTFRSKKRTPRGWDVVANCSNAQDRWTANVRLMVVGEQLVWTSERGSQSYLRCQPGLGVARAF